MFHVNSDSSPRTRRGFRGRGPRGWVRPDERLRDDVCELLTDDDGIDATYVVVRVERGEVFLGGWVSDRRDRHRAEDLAASIRGVREVHNEIRVQPEDDIPPHRLVSGPRI
jgi:osmotically-inducible protein OsmY